ncbi:MAG: FAD-dependent oxidoreductase, partial [Anaerolineales bacterium]|nr:FAD-dependent oxidoreductase [Anaerolineales bacterium]
MDQATRVIIIGGGVIGASAAYFLQKKGWTVTLLEKDRFGGGASHGNCGLIVPSHILPLNSPEILIKGFKWLFKKDAPLLIKPRFDPDLFKWLVQFAYHCRRKNIMASVHGRAALLKGAIDLYRSLIQEEGLECDWEILGALHAFCSFDELESHRAVDAFTAQFGISGKMMNRDDVLNMEPTLGNDIAGAWFYNQSAQLRPEALMKDLKRILVNRNIEIVEQAEVTGFRTNNSRAVAVVTNRGTFAAEQFVVATGAWTPLLGEALGCRIPIQPGKGYSVTMKRPSGGPSIPCFFEEAKVVAVPWPSGLRLGGTMEFTGYDESLNRHRLEALLQASKRYLKRMDLSGIEEEWCGWRPMTPDGLPIIDR